MLIIPSLYVLDGRTVALYKGDLTQFEQYSKNAYQFAKDFISRGAKTLLFIDLDASEKNDLRNDEMLKSIVDLGQASVIYAGGVREMERVDLLFEMGVAQVVLGVAAEDIFKIALEKYGPEKIIVGIKSKGDEVQTDKEHKGIIRVIDYAEKLPEMGVKTILLKDLLTEGTELNPNYDEMERALLLTSLRVYVSGGIGKMKNLELLKDTGAHGAAIGKSFYERDLDVAECIAKFGS